MREEELASTLFDAGVIKFGEFRLKLHEKNSNAPLSPIYIDLRILRSLPSVLEAVVFAYRNLTSELSFDYYADVPTAATPLVAVLSNITRVPMISPRMDSKGHGVISRIDGIFREGQTVLLIDDLITTANSKLEVISILEENALIVNDVSVLVDREQGGVQILEERGYACHAVFTLSELLEFYLLQGMIEQEIYKKTVTYLRSWGGLQ